MVIGALCAGCNDNADKLKALSAQLSEIQKNQLMICSNECNLWNEVESVRTNAIAIQVPAVAIGTQITNSYGLYIDKASGAANNYAADFNTGNVGIGSTAPVSSLDLSQKTDAIALPVGTTGQEPSTPVNGMIRYNSTYPDVEAYIGNIWTTLTTGGATATIDLGTSASVTNPSRTGDITTGLFSPATTTVAIAVGGVEAMRVNSSGYVGIGSTLPCVMSMCKSACAGADNKAQLSAAINNVRRFMMA